jgi:hypothetical protein
VQWMRGMTDSSRNVRQKEDNTHNSKPRYGT